MVTKVDNIAPIPDLGYSTGTIRVSEDEAEAIVQNYVNEISSVRGALHPNGDLLKLFELIQNAVQSRQESEKVPGDKRLLVLASDPPEEIDTEAITFSLLSRGPGQFNKGPPNSARVKELAPHYRGAQNHPEHIGEKLITMGRFFDSNIAFNIYARNDMTALKRVFWFENVMDSFRWLFRVHHIEALYQGTGDKAKVKIGNLELTKYPMTFFVRTEEIYQFGVQELKKFVVKTSVLL